MRALTSRLKRSMVLGSMLFSSVSFAELSWDQSVVDNMWFGSLLEQGAAVSESLDPSLSNSFNDTYYDLTHVLLATIAKCDEMAGSNETANCADIDPSYSRNTWVGYVEKSYQAYFDNYVYKYNYGLASHWRFTDGAQKLMVFSAEEPSLNLPVISTDVMANMRDMPAYSKLSEFTRDDGIWNVGVSRPLAYALEAHINSEQVGLERDDVRVDILINALLSHFRQWTNPAQAHAIKYTTLDGSKSWDTSAQAANLKPFMTGLAARALQKFYDWELANDRLDAHSATTQIPQVMSDFFLYLANEATVVEGNRIGDAYDQHVGKKMWIQNAGTKDGVTYGAFFYCDRDYEDPRNAAWTDGVYLASDLNMLIAPVYGWLAAHYKSSDADKASELLRIGDNVFMSGLHGRYIVQAKQYNQHYRWSMDYQSYRDNASKMSPPLPPQGFSISIK